MPVLVLEKRRFPRVSLAVNGILTYREGCYVARLENISLAGALVSLNGDDLPDIAQGERCSLALYRSGSRGALRLATRLVHCDGDLATVRFLDLDQNTRLMLRSIIAHQMPESFPAPPRRSICPS